jgi:hypothetical protein
MTLRLYDETEVRRALNNAVRDAGGTDAFAAAHKLNPAVVEIVRTRDGIFSARLLRALGFMRVTRYVKQGEG